MDKAEVETWAKRFIADLEVGGERVPLARVVAVHLAMLKTLRTAGLTWVGIAAILTRAGGRQMGGRPLSADRLRAEVSRASRRPTSMGSDEPEPAPRLPTRQAPPVPAQLHRSTFTPAASPVPAAATRSDPHSPAGDKDLSAGEIAAALARINRS